MSGSFQRNLVTNFIFRQGVLQPQMLFPTNTNNTTAGTTTVVMKKDTDYHLTSGTTTFASTEVSRSCLD
jgi:hypothetical protein